MLRSGLFMNNAERQALREKHRQLYHPLSYSKCKECSAPWPCDVIEVLDATEPLVTDIRASGTSDVLPVNECEHIVDKAVTFVPCEPGLTRVVERIFCTKCREKL